MKVVAFNGSPRMDKGDTALILNPFLEGLRSTGADVELYYTSRLNISPCRGEYSCWFATPGRCFQQDDMQLINPKLNEADIWVFAAPVYFWGMPGPLKTLLDRVLPFGEPFVTLQDGHCTHPARDNSKPRKLVLVSSCGLWEMDNFDPLRTHMETVCRMLGFEFAGALLRPHGSTFAAMLRGGAPLDDILKAAVEAGRQLGTSGEISSATSAAVARPLLSRDAYIQAANHFSQERVDAAGSSQQ